MVAKRRQPGRGTVEPAMHRWQIEAPCNGASTALHWHYKGANIVLMFSYSASDMKQFFQLTSLAMAVLLGVIL